MLSEDKVKDRLSIPFFMGIFGERDHWYHLFVSIYYHIPRKNQYGILYKATGKLFYKVQELFNLRKETIDISFGV